MLLLAANNIPCEYVYLSLLKCMYNELQESWAWLTTLLVCRGDALDGK
jgi:hypothetical protein